MSRSLRHIIMYALALCHLLLMNCLQVHAQPNRTDSPVFYGLSAYYGQFQVHTKTLYPYNGTHPFGVEFELSQFLLRDKIRETFGTFIKWGIGINYVNFDHADLGYALSGLAYIEPFLDSHGRWRYSLKAGCGLAYMSHPYDAATNPRNLTYSTKLAFPVFGGGSIYYFFTKQWGIKLTASFQHISNGGIKQPNLGINYPVIALGIEHSFNQYTIPPRKVLHSFTKERRVEIIAGYTLKEDTTNTNNLHVANLLINHSWQVSRINALTISALAEYQEQTDNSNAIDAWSIAPQLGNEFLFGKLYFGQQIGIYLLRGQSAPNLLLQNYYLRYKINQRLITGVNLKAHGRVADYLSFQFGYIF